VNIDPVRLRGIGKIVGRRLAVLPIALLAVATIAFFLIHLMPGDPAIAIAGEFANDEDIQKVRERLNLHRSDVDQYRMYIAGILRGDLGREFYTGLSVAGSIRRTLPNSAELVLAGLLIAGVIGVSLGTVASILRRRPGDRVARFVLTVTQSIPDFLLALILIYWLYTVFEFAPSPLGRIGVDTSAIAGREGSFLLLGSVFRGEWVLTRQLIGHMFMPAFTVGVVYSAYLGRVTRAALAPALDSPHVEFARACGLRPLTVLRYAWSEARTPAITYFAILFGALIGGVTIIETIFAWGGFGQWGLQAILALDIPAIQGFVLVTGTITLLVYLALDVLILILDPRVVYGGQGGTN